MPRRIGHEIDDDNVAERADADVAPGREHDRAGVMTKHVHDWHAPRGLCLEYLREDRALRKAHANPESDGDEHRAGDEGNTPCPIGERRRRHRARCDEEHEIGQDDSRWQPEGDEAPEEPAA